MSMSTRYRLAVPVAIVACMTALVACEPGLPATIKIGVAQPLSGSAAAMGQDMKNGAQLAINEINAQRLLVGGKPLQLELVSADDKDEPEGGKQAARQLVDAGVVAVVGHLSSGVSIAAAPVYAEKSIPQLAISTKPEYTQLNLPTTFRLVANDALQSKALGSYAAQQVGASKFAVVDDNTPYGKGLADLVAAEIKKNSKEVVVRKSLDDKTTDFAALVSELKGAGAQAVVTTLADFQAVALVTQLAGAGLSDMIVVGSDNIKTDQLLGANIGIRAVYASSPVLDVEDLPGGPKFQAAFQAAYKNAPVYGAHYAYDAVHVLANTIRKTRSADPKALTAELKRIDPIAPVTSMMRFGANGEQVNSTVAIYKLEKGRWEMQVSGSNW
jgi:branched-chain amino acid transport system substrate-binding protein